MKLYKEIYATRKRYEKLSGDELQADITTPQSIV
jgi:hypothetical protein